MKPLILMIYISVLGSVSAQDISDWEGHYSGTLQAKSTNGNEMSYHMEFIVSPIDDSTHNWIIIYGEDSLRQERNYLIRRTGRENHFLVDEQNSIVLNMDLIGNVFYSVFEVNGSLLHVQYELQKKAIVFTLTASSGKNETGNSVHEGEEIPLVYSYQTTTFQRAVLKRE